MQFDTKPEVAGMLPHPESRCSLPFTSFDRALQELQFLHFLAIRDFILEFRVTAKIPNLAGGFHVDVRPN
jgi:hypothetical protein